MNQQKQGNQIPINKQNKERIFHKIGKKKNKGSSPDLKKTFLQVRGEAKKYTQSVNRFCNSSSMAETKKKNLFF